MIKVIKIIFSQDLHMYLYQKKKEKRKWPTQKQLYDTPRSPKETPLSLLWNDYMHIELVTITFHTEYIIWNL